MMRRDSAGGAVRARARWLVLPAIVAGALIATWWLGSAARGENGAAEAVAASSPRLSALATPASAAAFAGPVATAGAGRPLSATGEARRLEQLALWRTRLERSQHAFDSYLAAARYPHESRPIAEHPDQMRPFEPIAEDRALRMPGGSPAAGMHLRTTQERVFLSGSESSRITLTLQDDAGRMLPLRVTRAVMQEVTPPGRTAGTVPYPMPVGDAGVQGDAVAADGVITALMQPARQGFGTFAGTVRLELALEYAGQPGFIYFDVAYSPEQAATWLPGVREAVVDGSLVFVLQAQVRLAGRYVVSARIDDAEGKPVALALFNAEVAAGLAEFKLPIFGKLLRDARPAFPLALRDVEAFLLKPDTHPDRVMLPRLAGVVHTSKTYPLAAFADREWESDERSRHVAELGRDVDEAAQKVRQLGP